MRKIPACFLFLLICAAAFSQQKALSVLGEKVPLYSERSYDAPVLAYLDWNTAVLGFWESGWYTISMPEGKTGYLSKWDAMESEILNDPVQAKRIAPSAETLYRMMKFFKRQGKTARAEDYALRIINDFRDEEYPTKDGCFKIAHLSYMYMISDPEDGVIYDAYLSAFSGRVLAEANMPAVEAMDAIAPPAAIRGRRHSVR